MAVYVLIPAFNEESTIGPLVNTIPERLFGRRVTTVVIDDGSTDGTARVADRNGSVVLRQTPNQGKGAALCRGLEYLNTKTFDVVVWMDGDGQHLPSSLPDIVSPVLFDDVDLCVGSRYLRSDHRSMAPLNRRVVRHASIRAVERITGFAVTDPFSGFRCFSYAAVEALQLEGCGYESELESCFEVARAGLSYREVPIPRIYGPDTSKMGHRHGALRGRVAVIAGYARTIHRAQMQNHAPEHVLARG